MQFKQQFLTGDAELRNEYRTPDWVYNPLNRVFDFTLDVAATPENAKTEMYYTIDDNGLSQEWGGIELPSGMRHNVFNNPPWSLGVYGDWVKRASDEFIRWGITVVQVLPFKPETKGFRPVWDYAKYLILPEQRIAFDLPDGTPSSGATFFSCVAVFTNLSLIPDEISILHPVGRIINLYRGLYNP